MEYNIGDLVVRHCFDEYDWQMVGIITAKRLKYHTKKEKYYTIQWGNPKYPVSTSWQAHEFELIETAKKNEEKT